MFWGINCTCPKIVLSFRQKLELCKANSPSWIQPDTKKLCISITNAKTIWRIVHNGRGKHGGLALSQSWPSVVLLCPVSRFFYIFTNGCRGGPVTKSDQSDVQLIWVEGSPWGQHWPAGRWSLPWMWRSSLAWPGKHPRHVAVGGLLYIFTNGCCGGPVTNSDQSDVQLILVECRHRGDPGGHPGWFMT